MKRQKDWPPRYVRMYHYISSRCHTVWLYLLLSYGATAGYRCIVSWSTTSRSLVVREAEWISQISPVNANTRQRLTMCSIVVVMITVFDAPFVHQMTASSMRVLMRVNGGPLALRKIKPVVGSGTRLFFLMSVNPHSLLHLSLTLVSRMEAVSVQKGRCGGPGLRSLHT